MMNTHKGDILVRRLDWVAVYGRTQGLAVYELLGMADEGALEPPGWVGAYEAGLDAYARRDWAGEEILMDGAGASIDRAHIAATYERIRPHLRRTPAMALSGPYHAPSRLAPIRQPTAVSIMNTELSAGAGVSS